MLLSLPTYKFDYPRDAPSFGEEDRSRSTRQSGNKIRSATVTVPLQWFSTNALHEVITNKKPALFKIRNFDQQDTFDRIYRFAAHDKHTFCTSHSSHGSDGLKLSVVLDKRNTKNLHRIVDGIYPERDPPSIHPTEILNQVLSVNSPLLTTWLEIKVLIDSHYDVDKMQHDPETRDILIVTGNCSGVVGTHHNGGVLLDRNVTVVPCHYDDYGGWTVMGAGEKDI
jgi:hypothetical protein